MVQDLTASDGDAGRPERTPFEFDGEKYRRASAHQQEYLWNRQRKNGC